MHLADSQRVLLAGCFLASIVFSSSALAQTYLEEYKAYNAALEANDAEGAITHAYAAWQAAEEELGDDRLTAILAYNYGQQVLFSDTENALPALRRADELRQAGLAELPEGDLTLSLAYAEFAISGGSRREANDLRALLAQFEATGVPPNRNAARMWLALASSDVEHERYRYAETSARSAEAAVTAAYPDDYRTHATTIVLQGVAYLVPWPRRKSDIKTAMDLFDRAIELFPPQSSLEDFDTLLAQAMAWKYAAGAAHISDGHGDITPSDEEHEHDVFNLKGKTLEECDAAWEERESPKYPHKALRRGYIGAVVFGYRFGDDTRIHDVRILAEVPSGTFSEIVLESAKKWRLKAPPPDDPLCREKFISMISFVIE